jgi:hypothetical protein
MHFCAWNLLGVESPGFIVYSGYLSNFQQAMQPCGESSMMASSPSQTDYTLPACAEIIDLRQLWRYLAAFEVVKSQAVANIRIVTLQMYFLICVLFI